MKAIWYIVGRAYEAQPLTLYFPCKLHFRSPVWKISFHTWFATLGKRTLRFTFPSQLSSSRAHLTCYHKCGMYYILQYCFTVNAKRPQFLTYLSSLSHCLFFWELECWQYLLPYSFNALIFFSSHLLNILVIRSAQHEAELGVVGRVRISFTLMWRTSCGLKVSERDPQKLIMGWNLLKWRTLL